MHTRMCYEARGDIKSTYLRWRSQMLRISRLSPDDWVFQAGFKPSIRKVRLCSEQKNVLRMNKIVHKFTFPSDLLVDCCACTFSVAKAYTLLQLHTRFVGCDLDPGYVTSSLPYLSLVSARKVLNKESEITENDDAQYTAFTFNKATKELDLKRGINVLDTNKGLSNYTIVSVP